MTKLYSLIFVSFFSLSSCSLFSCSSFYGSSDTYENFEVSYNNYNQEAFVSEYNWPDQNDYHITIPDTYQNSETNKIYTVTAMGGFFGRGLPCPFYVNFSSFVPTENIMQTYSDFYEEGCENDYTSFTYYDFTLEIGTNIKTIFADAYIYVVQRTNGSKDGYIYRVHATVDENNPDYYSEEGKIYRTKDSTLCSELIYW